MTYRHLLILLSFLFIINLVKAQRPTFIDFIPLDLKVNRMGGLFQQTDSTYIGIYSESRGFSRDSPYFVTYDLNGVILDEGAILVNIPHWQYIWTDILQTNDNGFIITGNGDNDINTNHCIKLDKFVNEEWRIVSSNLDSINGKDSVPIYLAELKDTMYSLITEDFTSYSIATFDLSTGQKLNQFPTSSIDSSLIGFNIPSRIRKFDDLIYFNLQNSFQSDWTAHTVYLNSMNNLKSEIVPASRLSHLTYNIVINENEYLLFKDSVSEQGELFDLYDSDGIKIKSQSIIYKNAKVLSLDFTQNKGITTCLISLASDQFQNEYNNSKWLQLVIRIDSLGSILNYWPIADIQNEALISSFHVFSINQFDDGYYSIYFTTTPGITNSPKYFAVVDSNLNVNGEFFLESFFDSTMSNSEATKFEQEIIFYPNPVSSTLTIQTDRFLNPSYNLINLTGKLLESGQLTNENNSIDFARFSSGVYFLQFQTEFGIITKKVIKN